MDVKKFWKYLTTDSSKTKKKTSKKEVEVNSRQSTTIKKLSSPTVLLILINSILGSSLFFVPGYGIAYSGAASIIAWIALFVIATFMMLYIGELVSLHPTSGGTYEFCKRAYGRAGSFFAGWLIWVAGNFGMALGIVAAAEYLLPVSFPNYFLLRIIFTIVLVIAFNYFAFRGINFGATVLVVFGIISLVVLVLMTLPSFIDFPALFSGMVKSPFDLELFKPFFRSEGGGIFAFLGLSLFLISESFFGFEIITYMANEVKEPKKLYKLMVLAMIISGVLMFIYVASSFGIVSYHDYINNPRPFAVQAMKTLGNFGENFIILGVVLVSISASAGWPIVGSRLIRAMSADKLFPKHFAVLHPKHRSPYRAVYFQTIAVLVFSWFIFRGYLVNWNNPYRTIYLIYIVISMIILSLVLLAVPILRKKEAKLKRPFKAPLGKVLPFVFVAGFIYLIFNWIKIEGGVAWSILKLTASFIIVGVPFYFLVEMFYSKKAIVGVNEYLSYFVLLGEKLFFPFSIRNKILKGLGNLKGKVILEYGCSVGTLTRKLARKVTEKGKIYALNLSEKKVEITSKRTRHLPHVSVHHHPYLNDFKLKFPGKADRVISVGMLSYMQNPKKILTSLAKKVNHKAEIIFVDFDKFFYIVPNVAWITDDKKLVAMFKEAGFNVKVEKKRGLLWTYIIISGKKR